MENLRVGDISSNGQVEIIAEDKLCFLVKSQSNGATGIRTISKVLLSEYIQYLENFKPDFLYIGSLRQYPSPIIL